MTVLARALARNRIYRIAIRHYERGLENNFGKDALIGAPIRQALAEAYYAVKKYPETILPCERTSSIFNK